MSASKEKLLTKYEISMPIFKCDDDKSIFICRLHEVEGFQSCYELNVSFQIAIGTTEVSRAEDQLKQICEFWNVCFRRL